MGEDTGNPDEPKVNLELKADSARITHLALDGDKLTLTISASLDSAMLHGLAGALGDVAVKTDLDKAALPETPAPCPEPQSLAEEVELQFEDEDLAEAPENISQEPEPEAENETPTEAEDGAEEPLLLDEEDTEDAIEIEEGKNSVAKPSPEPISDNDLIELEEPLEDISAPEEPDRYGEPQAEVEWSASVDGAFGDLEEEAAPEESVALVPEETQAQNAEPVPEPEEAPQPKDDGLKIEEMEYTEIPEPEKPVEAEVANETASTPEQPEPPKEKANEPQANEDDKNPPHATASLIRYVCPKCKTEGTQYANKLGAIVTCSSCGKAMRLTLKK